MSLELRHTLIFLYLCPPAARKSSTVPICLDSPVYPSLMVENIEI